MENNGFYKLLILEIINGRHPVLDALESAGTFVPNDTIIKEKECIQLITGPNMAGKSTYIRQTALLCLMAQTGYFIPAQKAVIGICNRIFARVGASDDIARGQSTFMVEMTETARIFNQATPQSLIILDEIGRGTSTYDGLSLAWAIVEHIHDKIGCRTLFASHYHELTELADTMEGVQNFNVAVKEERDEVVFLHKIFAGSAGKSYGIHVAKLAGVPQFVVRRSQEILNNLENKKTGKENNKYLHKGGRKFSAGGIQFSLFGADDHPVVSELQEINIDELKPIEALQLLAKWKELV